MQWNLLHVFLPQLKCDIEPCRLLHCLTAILQLLVLEAGHHIGDAPFHIVHVALLLFFNVLKQI